jgi:hypothetical protein
MTDARMRGTTLQNLKVFQRLCGKKNLGAVVFGTTKSGKLTPETFAKREKQLSDVYWKDFKKQGAIVFKLLPSRESARQLVQTVLGRVQADERVLRIQEELVELAKTLPATEAGKELKYTLEEILEHQKRALDGDHLTEEQIAAHKQKIATIAPQIKQMTAKFSFSQFFLKMFGLVSCFAFSLSMYNHLSLCLRVVEGDATGLRSWQNDPLDLTLDQSRSASHRAHSIVPFYFPLICYFHASRICSHL